MKKLFIVKYNYHGDYINESGAWDFAIENIASFLVEASDSEEAVKIAEKLLTEDEDIESTIDELEMEVEEVKVNTRLS